MTVKPSCACSDPDFHIARHRDAVGKVDWVVAVAQPHECDVTAALWLSVFRGMDSFLELPDGGRVADLGSRVVSRRLLPLFK